MLWKVLIMIRLASLHWQRSPQERFCCCLLYTSPMGAKIMTLECGMRFLTDYLEGDHYFKIHREGHNLDRCRTQFKLVADMEKKWDTMAEIVRKYKK